VFKRRDSRNWLKIVADFFYPRGGWTRAASYVAHRLRRLPDSPHKISRGIAAGVFVSFTPFFGFHFVLAAMVAAALRGNILASLLATFFGNPLTFPVIATVSLEVGNTLMGRTAVLPVRDTVRAFGDASVELWRNLKALFTMDTPHWESLGGFFDSVFLPYLLGGLLPGLAAGIAAYFLSQPVIAAYQAHRRKKLRKKWEEMRAITAPKKADGPDGAA